MSEKVTPLHPRQQHGRTSRRRIWCLVGVIVLVVVILLVILFRQELNLDRIRRYVSYFGVKDTGTYGEYAFESHNSNAYCTFGDGLAVASVAGLDIYGESGQELETVSGAISVPAVSAGEDIVLAWDVGGTRICLADYDAGNISELNAGGPLLDLDQSPKDYICYAAAEDGYKTVLTVLDPDQKEIYQWLSSSQYMPVCAVSEDGELLAAIALGQADGVFESRLQFLPTDREEQGPATSLGNQLIYDLKFVDAGKLCAVGESSMRFYDTDAALIGEYSYQDQYLKAYDDSGNGFVALSLSMYQAGSHYSVATVDSEGREIASVYIGREILGLSTAGNYIAVLTADNLQIYTSDLTLYAETDQVMGASHVAMREDGSALLIGSGTAQLYLP